MAGSTALVSRGGRVVVVVMRWPGTSTLEREGGAGEGDVAGFRWTSALVSRGGKVVDVVAVFSRTLRA